MANSLSTKRKIRKSIKASRKISRPKKKKSYNQNAFGSAKAQKVARMNKLSSTKKRNERNRNDKAIRYANALLAPFDERIVNMFAKSSGFLQRKSKLMPLYFIAAIVFSYLTGGDKSISLISSNLFEWFSASITPQGLSARLKNKSTAKFLKIFTLLYLIRN